MQKEAHVTEVATTATVLADIRDKDTIIYLTNMTLKEVLNQHLMVQIPAKTFAWKLKSINLDNVSEADIGDDIEAEAAVCNRLSELWKNDVFNENEEVSMAKMNVLMLLCHALELLANQN